MTALPAPAGIPRILPTGAGALGWVESRSGHSLETAVTDPAFCRGMAAAWQTVAARLEAARKVTAEEPPMRRYPETIAGVPEATHALWCWQDGYWAETGRGTEPECSAAKKKKSQEDASNGKTPVYAILPVGKSPRNARFAGRAGDETPGGAA
jgi:hypothetical protein